MCVLSNNFPLTIFLTIVKICVTIRKNGIQGGTNMTQRKATAADIPQLILRRLEFLKEEYPDTSPAQLADFECRLQAFFTKHLDVDLYAYVAEEQGEIIATTLLQVFERLVNPSCYTGRSGTIVSVYTRPEYRRKGIGTLLVRMALEESKNLDLSYVDLKATSQGHPVYEKIGFVNDPLKNIPMLYHL